MAIAIKHLTNADFDSTINGDTPVLVDFWAEWCGPCKRVDAILKEVAETETRFLIAKVDVDEYPELSVKYSVLGIPTLILFSLGREKTRLGTTPSKEKLLSSLEPHLS